MRRHIHTSTAAASCPLFPLVPATTQADKDGIKVTSKRYLNRVTDLFDRKYDNPANVVFKACRRIAAKLGGDTALVFTIGPGKETGRLIEKALMQKGRYDLIRDYARAMFVVYDLDLIALLIRLLRAAAGFHAARGKNRFAPVYDASDSAGYRDYQLLFRTSDGWLIEIQIIPAAMYTLKEELGRLTW